MDQFSQPPKPNEGTTKEGDVHRAPARFVVEPRRLELRPGIDPDRVSRFADELEDKELSARV